MTTTSRIAQTAALILVSPLLWVVGIGAYLLIVIAQTCQSIRRIWK